MYDDLGAVVEYTIAPKGAGFPFNGYAAAVEVELCGAARAGGVPHCVVYFYAVAGEVAVGTGPVVCPKVAVAHRWRANDESAQSVEELALLEVYLWDIDSLCLAHCIGDLVLANVCSLLYADELPEAACLVVRVDVPVKYYISAVARVWALDFAPGKGKNDS